MHSPITRPLNQTGTWAFWRVEWQGAAQEFGLELATGYWCASRPQGLGIIPSVRGEGREETQRRIMAIARSEGFVFADGTPVVAALRAAA